jgi:hypothetical protein
MPPVSTCDVIVLVDVWKGEPRAEDDVASLAWMPLEALYDERFDGMYPGLAAKLKEYR